MSILLEYNTGSGSPEGVINGVSGYTYKDTITGNEYKCLSGTSWEQISSNGIPFSNRILPTLNDMKSLRDIRLGEKIYAKDREVDYRCIQNLKDKSIIIGSGTTELLTVRKDIVRSVNTINLVAGDIISYRAFYPTGVVGGVNNNEFYMYSPLNGYNSFGIRQTASNLTVGMYGGTKYDNINYGVQVHLDDGTQIAQVNSSNPTSPYLPYDTWLNISVKVAIDFSDKAQIQLEGYSGVTQKYYKLSNWSVKGETFYIRDISPTYKIDGSLGTRWEYANQVAGTTTPIIEIESGLINNDFDVIVVDETNYYRVLNIAPKDNLLKPQNYGVVSNTINTSRENECSAAFQAMLDSPYNIDIPPGFYYINAPLYVNKAKSIKLYGSLSTDSQIEGEKSISMLCINGNGDGSNFDLFNIFESGFHFNGGVIDVGGCIFDQDKIYAINEDKVPTYTPPAVFKYWTRDNIIQNSSIKTLVMNTSGDGIRNIRWTNEDYGAGYIGVTIDMSRTNPNGVRPRPGSGELHYIDINIESSYNFCPVFLDQNYPHQYNNVKVAEYVFSSSIIAPPADTTFRFNNGTISNATQLYLSKTAFHFSFGDLVEFIEQLGNFTDLQFIDSVGNSIKKTVYGAIVDNVTYWTIPVNTSGTFVGTISSGTTCSLKVFNYSSTTLLNFQDVQSGKDKFAVRFADMASSSMLNGYFQPGTTLAAPFKYTKFYNHISATFTMTNVSGSTGTIVNSYATIPITGFINAGDYLWIDGFTNPANNGLYRETGGTVSNTALVVTKQTGETLIAQATGTRCTIKANSTLIDNNINYASYFPVERDYVGWYLGSANFRDIKIGVIDIGKSNGVDVKLNQMGVHIASVGISFHDDTFMKVPQDQIIYDYDNDETKIKLENSKLSINRMFNYDGSFLSFLDDAYLQANKFATISVSWYKNQGNFDPTTYKEEGNCLVTARVNAPTVAGVTILVTFINNNTYTFKGYVNAIWVNFTYLYTTGADYKADIQALLRAATGDADLLVSAATPDENNNFKVTNISASTFRLSILSDGADTGALKVLDGSLGSFNLSIPDSLFSISNPVQVTYNNTNFEQDDFFEIVVENFTQSIPVYDLIVFFASSTYPKYITCSQESPDSVAIVNKVLGNYKEPKGLFRFNFTYLNNSGGKGIFRFTGAPVKADGTYNTISIQRLTASPKGVAHTYQPIIYKSGGQRIYGSLVVDQLKTLRADGLTQQQLIPQSEGTIEDLATLITRLKAAGILY